MSDRIEWSIPDVGDEEFAQIRESFAANWLTSGPKVKLFEHRMADWMHVPHAIAVSNGSLAIELVLQSYGIGPGDEVVVPSMTYYATASSVARVGATPVFADVDPLAFNLDPEALAAAIGPRTRAALFIDMGGSPADFDGLKRVADEHGITLIQDAAQSLGGEYRGQPLGTQTETSTMSFHMAKVMTTVEGGMIFTRNDDLATRLRSYRNQGESAKYVHTVLGTNARMTDLGAGIGLAQLEKLPRFLSERARVAAAYDARFEGNENIGRMRHRPEGRAANFLYNVLVENRTDVVEALVAANIDYRICYSMSVFEQHVFRSGAAPARVTPSPVAQWYASRTLALPMAPSLTADQIDRVADVVISSAAGVVQLP